MMSFRYRSVNYKVVQQFLLTPAVPENPLGAQPWKKKNKKIFFLVQILKYSGAIPTGLPPEYSKYIIQPS